MTFALFLMLGSLQEELRPYYITCSVCGSMFSNWACASEYPSLPFEYSSSIWNKRSLLSFARGRHDSGNDSSWSPICCKDTLLCETTASGGQSGLTHQEGIHFGFGNNITGTFRLGILKKVLWKDNRVVWWWWGSGQAAPRCNTLVWRLFQAEDNKGSDTARTFDLSPVTA